MPYLTFNSSNCITFYETDGTKIFRFGNPKNLEFIKDYTKTIYGKSRGTVKVESDDILLVAIRRSGNVINFIEEDVEALFNSSNLNYSDNEKLCLFMIIRQLFWSPMKILMFTLEGCQKCHTAKLRLGTKMKEIEEYCAEHHSSLVEKYGLQDAHFPVFVVDYGDRFEIIASILKVESLLLELYTTEETAERMREALSYSADLAKKIEEIKIKFREREAELDGYKEMLFDGSIKFAVKTFIYDYTGKSRWSGQGEQKYQIKFNKKFLYKEVNEPSWSRHARFRGMDVDDFTRLLVPSWKPEYIDKIDYRFRTMFEAIIKNFRDLSKAHKRPEIEMKFKIRPMTLCSIPSMDKTVVGPDITINYSNDFRLRLSYGTRWNDGFSVANNDDALVLFVFKSQIDETFERVQAACDLAISQLDADIEEFKNILAPVLIARALSLEQNGKESY